MRRLLAALAAAAILLGLAPAGIGLPASRVARGAEYTLATVAAYDVQPDEDRIVVKVDVTFTNTTPDPARQFSVFDVVDLAIHSGATSVAATDSRGTLRLTVATRNGVRVASVRPRAPVRYKQTIAFSLTYVLPDGATPDIRVRPSAVVFPAWSFGTSGRVAITLPADYDVRVDGDELTVAESAATVRLESGPVPDPTTWLARVTAVSPTSYTTLSEGVALASGTVDLQVRAWADDEAWGEATLSLLADALPLLEAEIGLDYPRLGPLVVVESVPDLSGELGEAAAESGEIAIGFNQPPFTTLHQVAHVWISEQLAADRWIREGFASHAAAAVAAQLEVALPYDPHERAEELAEAEFPLVSWGAGEATAEQDAWAYAMSWAAAEQIVAVTGRAAVRLAWQRIAAGVGAYEPVTTEPPGPSGRPVEAVDSRRLLDHLDAVSGGDVESLFFILDWGGPLRRIPPIFDDATYQLGTARRAARAAYEELLAVAGDWGAPDPVIADLAAWRFAEAQAAIAAATRWLAARDALLADVEAAGLVTPARLQDRYRRSGGGADAQDELDAEAAVVAAYGEMKAEVAEEPSVVERVGLLGGEEPEVLLAEAASLFAEGDLRGAAENVETVRARLAGAATDGLVRLGSVAAVLVALLALAIVALRRRRDRGYTARP